MKRSWPTSEMYEILGTGTPEQLHNMLAFLPKADTQEQDNFIREIERVLRLMENIQ